MKIVYKARDITEAHIVAGLLHSQGIDSHVSGYYLQGAVGDLGAQDFANVQVADKHFEAARAVVVEYERGRYEDTAAEVVYAADAEPEDAVTANDKHRLTTLAANAVWIAALVFGVLIVLLYFAFV